MNHPRKEIRNQCYRFLAEKQYEKVANILEEADRRYPEYDWYLLFLGDIYRYYLNNPSEALLVYETCYKRGIDRFDTTTLSPMRYLLKRMTEMLYQLGKYEEAIPYFEKFISFTPSNFHEDSFCQYADSLVQVNQKDKAIEILTMGTQYSASRKIRRQLADLAATKDPIEEFPLVRAGYERIPIKTAILKPGDSIVEVIDEYTRGVRRPGDILTVASAVTALTERRIRCIDEIEPTFFAQKLSSYVHNDNFPFGGNAPLCNPLSMQVALEEVGFLRIFFSAVVGGILGKIFKGSGMFYRFAGEQAALIDDMPGAIPPFDYYVILGPSDSRDIANQIKGKTGCEAAIIDANDLQIAWVVGSSNPKQKKLIEEVMKDNPAGNGDQTTPIVLLRKVDSPAHP
jgi:tetratricopeptide (TPR) repeat protein